MNQRIQGSRSLPHTCLWKLAIHLIFTPFFHSHLNVLLAHFLWLHLIVMSTSGLTISNRWFYYFCSFSWKIVNSFSPMSYRSIITPFLHRLFQTLASLISPVLSFCKNLISFAFPFLRNLFSLGLLTNLSLYHLLDHANYFIVNVHTEMLNDVIYMHEHKI